MKAVATMTTFLNIGDRHMLLEEGKEYEFNEGEMSRIPPGLLLTTTGSVPTPPSMAVVESVPDAEVPQPKAREKKKK